MTIWFTSDTHYGHAGILMHQRPRAAAFKDTVEMDDALIDACNAVVDRDDILCHQGDFCWMASRAGHYRQRLNVRKLHMIRGNHDSSSLAGHCTSFKEMHTLKLQLGAPATPRLKIALCHYPMLSWDGLHYGGIHLYGHSHGGFETELDGFFPDRLSKDVGVDNIFRLFGQWRPISLDEILTYLRKGKHDALSMSTE